MDDKYLDNVFREKFELPQHHDFEEAAWLDLESRLNNESNRRVIPWRWLAAAGILLPILLSSFYFYVALRQTEVQLANLETKMNRLLHRTNSKATEQDLINAPMAYRDESAENEICHQTTVTEPTAVVVVPESTILKTKSIANKASSVAQNNLSAIGSGNFNSINTITPTATTVINHKENRNRNINEALASTSMALPSKNQIAATGFPVPKTPTMNYGQWITKERVLNVQESALSQATAYFIPVGFEIGTSIQVGIGGYSNTKTTEHNPHFSNKGVRGALKFVNGVDLTIGANVATYTYETKAIQQDFPNVVANNTSDLFQKVVVSEDMVQVPIGLKYNFGYDDDVFVPFVEIGGIAKRCVEKHYKFEYLPTTQSGEPYAILPKPNRVTENFVMNTVSGTLGAKWNPNLSNQILDNIVIQAEIFANTDFEAEHPALMAGVGISANYTF